MRVPEVKVSVNEVFNNLFWKVSFKHLLQCWRGEVSVGLRQCLVILLWEMLGFYNNKDWEGEGCLEHLHSGRYLCVYRTKTLEVWQSLGSRRWNSSFYCGYQPLNKYN